jgi:hypothetical protein
MKHFIKLIKMIAALVLSGILFPLALIYNIVVIFKLGRFFVYLLKFIIELFKLIFDVFEKAAVIIDRLGNVILGNIFNDLFLYKEFRKLSKFYQSEVTISASFGHAHKCGYLNSKGEKFRSMLDKVFGKDHCLNAHEFDLLKQTFKKSKTGIS